jgi:hypothetical protein
MDNKSLDKRISHLYQYQLVEHHPAAAQDVID